MLAGAANIPTQGSAPAFDPKGNTLQTLPSATGPSYGQQVASAAQSGVQEIGSAFNGSLPGDKSMSNAQGFVQPLNQGLTITQGLAKIAGSPLAPAFKPLSDAISSISDKISNIKSVQDFSNTPAGKAVATATDMIGKASDTLGLTLGVQGGIEAGKGAIDAIGKTDLGSNPFQGGTQISTPAPTALDAATQAREAAAQAGVKGVQNMAESVSDFKNDLGTTFQKGAADIAKVNPNLRLNLSDEQLNSLNALKDSKSFSLPDYLRVGKTAPGDISGITKYGSLDPVQAQDLIRQLNKSTFLEKGSGVAVDQSKIGLTNEIKSAANEAFGKPFQKLYSDYSAGSNAVEKISDIVNIDKNATPSDVNKSLTAIQKLGKTPEGRIILQNAINEFKNTSGIDLTDPVKAAHQIVDKQVALEEAQSQNEKGSFGKQILKGATNPARIGGRIAVGLGFTAGLALLRAIGKAASGK